MRCIAVTALLLLSANMACAQNAKLAGAAPEAAQDGFVSLFDGKTLDGWLGDVKHYAVEDGAIVCHGGNLFTKNQYANFIFRFEFKTPPGGNNGIGIRTPLRGDAAYVGMEIQIQDDSSSEWKGEQPYQRHGAIYGVAPAKSGALKPAGQWNSEEIEARGSRIKVTVNGIVVTDVDISKIDKTPDGKEHPGLHNAKGYIGFLGHNSPVAFRNLRVKELP